MMYKDFLSLVEEEYKKCVLCNNPLKQCKCPGEKHSIMYYTKENNPKGQFKETLVYGKIDQNLHRALKKLLSTRGVWNSTYCTFGGKEHIIKQKLKQYSTRLGYLVNW